MKIKQIRSATMILTIGSNNVLIDPMLMPKNVMRTLVRDDETDLTNPMIDLPQNIDDELSQITHALITHTHFDHLDEVAQAFLKEKQIPTYCVEHDKAELSKLGLKLIVLDPNKENSFLDNGVITVTSTQHGRGKSLELMGNGAGFLISFEHQPSLYITGDTMLTEDVKKVISTKNPDYIVAPGGCATVPVSFPFAVGDPILMTPDEILELSTLTSGKLILNHFDTLDHCTISRDKMCEFTKDETNIIIPNDGELISL